MSSPIYNYQQGVSFRWFLIAIYLSIRPVVLLHLWHHIVTFCFIHLYIIILYICVAVDVHFVCNILLDSYTISEEDIRKILCREERKHIVIYIHRLSSKKKTKAFWSLHHRVISFTQTKHNNSYTLYLIITVGWLGWL